MVDQMNKLTPILPTKIKDNMPLEPKTDGKDFSVALDKAINETLSSKADISSPGLSFSKHAMERMKDRQIRMDLQKIEKLDSAIEKASQKGSRESLIITDDSAFIVNIPKRKIITAMDKSQMMENVFTNIDSTIIA